jgi:hypothetical protein
MVDMDMAVCPYIIVLDNCMFAAAEILPASTWDWVPTLSGGSFAWYIERLAEAVQQLQAKHQQQISLVSSSTTSAPLLCT